MSLLIAGYPYIKETYLKTFDSYPDDVFFLLPKIWKAKSGKLVFKAPTRPNVYTTRSLFYHSNYPVVGGLLKGWMPFFPLHLLKIKNLNKVFSASEPVLLTTLYQGFWTKLLGKKHFIFSWENISYKQKFKGLKGLVQMSILKLNLLFCDAIVCGNKKGAEIFRSLTDKPIEVIPLSGVNSQFFKKTTKEKKFQDLDLTDKVVFVFAGAIGYRKGIHLILESMTEVTKELPNSYLVVAGFGEYEESLKFKVQSLKLDQNVIFIPWLDSVGLRELLSVSDVFLYPSLSFGGWEEQFGYSMAEASLMEIPVISTRTGSIEEVVLDGVTGLLIEPDSIKSLTEAMLKLGRDENLRNSFGKAGRKYIEENYDYKIIADKFYNFFQKT
ncbi:MAG: glycosyltransferase [bacterium]|nr:glycosyltransferase [bacterium]